LYRHSCAAVIIWFIAVLQLPSVLAQTADQGVILPKVSSTLGQPLLARLTLDYGVAGVGGGVSARVASASEFQKLGIRRYQVVDRIALTLDDDGLRGKVLQLATSEPLYEPSLRVVVALTDDEGARLLPLELLLPSPDVLGVDRRAILVYPNDTLWRIADRTRNRAVTNNQQMLAVQRLNPMAFLGDNINGLKEWSMLSLPSFAEALEVPAREAAETVTAQHGLWRSGQRETAPVTSELVQTKGEVRITAAQDPAAQTFDESLMSGLEERVDDESLYPEPVYEEQNEYQIEAPVQQTDDSASTGEEGGTALPRDGANYDEFGTDDLGTEDLGTEDLRTDDLGTEAAIENASYTEASASPATAENAQALASDDPYDLDDLEAQIRQEQGSGIDGVMTFLVSPQGIGLLSGLTFVALLVLLLMRRRAAEQERELDHALREEEPLLPDQPDVGEDLSGGDDDGVEGGVEDVYTTRLKLAEAYLEMGDTDGAREMLEEVMADGSLEQQEVARRIMERVDNGDG
jgi:pilus assembly protein FimV